MLAAYERTVESVETIRKRIEIAAVDGDILICIDPFVLV